MPLVAFSLGDALTGAFLDGGSTAIGTAETPIGELPSSFSSGGQALVIASQQYNNTTAGLKTIAAGALKLQQNNAPVGQSSNAFALRISSNNNDVNPGFGSALLNRFAPNPATSAYEVKSAATTTGVNGETKILAIQAPVPTKLGIPLVNGGANPTAGTPFEVVVEARDANGVAGNVSIDTSVTLSLKTGTGTLAGTLTGTIPADTNSVTISGVTYSKAESGVVLTATRSGGDNLAAGDSAPFTVDAGAASPATSTITTNPASIPADGTSTAAITVQLKDASGNNLTTGGDTVTLATDRGTLGAVTDNANGTYTATLTSGTTTGTATITGTVNGVVIADTATVEFVQSAVNLMPTSLDFGDVVVGQTLPPQTVTLKNTGTSDLNLGPLALSGAQAGDYALVNDNCSSQVIAPAANCTFEVTFTPSDIEARAAQVDTPSDSPSSPDAVPLTGTGLGPRLVISQLSVDFGDAVVGETSPAQTVTLSNPGSAVLTVSAISSPEPPFAADAAGTTCPDPPFILDPGQTCRLAFTFSPTDEGAAMATITVDTDAPNGTINIELHGTGIPPPPAVLTPLRLDFVNVEVGVESAPMTLTLSSTGAVPVVAVDGIAVIGGAAAADYWVVVDNCIGLMLDPGEFCTIDVTFMPQIIGTRLGWLEVRTDPPISDTAALVGSGVTEDNIFSDGME
ncbi:MAG: choice-of-anchor D domain-containing protein [Gammaproteobacteria bacterium]|nr:choice-of-anchor D domain-containing protein [Gammaproteobacteria bacterium]